MSKKKKALKIILIIIAAIMLLIGCYMIARTIHLKAVKQNIYNEGLRVVALTQQWLAEVGEDAFIPLEDDPLSNRQVDVLSLRNYVVENHDTPTIITYDKPYPVFYNKYGIWSYINWGDLFIVVSGIDASGFFQYSLFFHAEICLIDINEIKYGPEASIVGWFGMLGSIFKMVKEGTLPDFSDLDLNEAHR